MWASSDHSSASCIKSVAFLKLLHGLGGSTMATKEVIIRFFGSSGRRTFQTCHAVEPACTASFKEVSLGSGVAALTCTEAIK